MFFSNKSDFLSQNNLLSSNPSGFKSSYSTETALLSMNFCVKPRDQWNGCRVIISHHQILLFIPSELGISGTALLWFESYLTIIYSKWQGKESSSNITYLPLGYCRDRCLVPYSSQYRPPFLVQLSNHMISLPYSDYTLLSYSTVQGTCRVASPLYTPITVYMSNLRFYLQDSHFSGFYYDLWIIGLPYSKRNKKWASWS